ncbi:MAG: GNAT family N-acetyltransferase [Planctomycetota bacterium]|jgi:N-acetylglutamate synthase-like GNAT family acetyltransferase
MALGFVPDSPLEFMNTRPISSDDTAPVAELVQLVRQRPNDMVDPFPPATETEILADMGARGRGPGRTRVALGENGEVVGCGAVDYSPAMKRALLVGPVVHPAQRTKGHGRNLMQAMVQNARDAHQKHVRACVAARNGAGQALLRAEGFRATGRHTCLRLSRPREIPALEEMQGIRVERVDPDDGEAYFKFTSKLVPRQPRQVGALLKANDYAAFLAHKGGRPVACVEVDMRWGETATVENVDGPPSLLHRGLGNRLLAEAAHVAFANDRIQAVELLMPGTDRARHDQMRARGFEVLHELVTFELRI